MIIKLMVDDGLPDGDPFKQFEIIADVIRIRFLYRGYPWHPMPGVDASPGWYSLMERRGFPTPSPRYVDGNIYILDEFGKTFDKFLIDRPAPV